MLTQANAFDITGTVRLDDPQAVADAVCTVLRDEHGELGDAEGFLRQAFADVENAFQGRYPCLLACDTPYHDLRHSLDTALLLARMVAGWNRGTGSKLAADEAALTVFLGLVHDVGFLRRVDEDELLGPHLMREHEWRGVEFARGYLASGPFADRSDWAELILATCFAHSLAGMLEGRTPQAMAAARLIGSADLISQVADRLYLERCRDFLFYEMDVCGANRITNDAGTTTVLYENGLHLLAKTPSFYQHSIRHRLTELFGGVDQVLCLHFGGKNPYQESIDRNLAYLNRLIDDGTLADGLRRNPAPHIPKA
jgi:hypothetical protein